MSPGAFSLPLHERTAVGLYLVQMVISPSERWQIALAAIAIAIIH